MNDTLKKILPARVAAAVALLNSSKLYEIRLRADKPVTVGYGNSYAYLSAGGITDSASAAVKVTSQELNELIMRACSKSLYAVNDNICEGYLTAEGGVRIGVAGKTVFENGQVKTIKDFTSVNVRIPHEVIGCAKDVLPYLKCGNCYYSTLIVSPPGAGKTTLLRDLARAISDFTPVCNVLIVDEREEIAAEAGGKQLLNVGCNCDVISGCTKQYAFTNGIRALKPDLIITDELFGGKDCAAVYNAINCGVKVFASVHARNHERLVEKKSFKKLLQNKCFDRFVDVSCARGAGTVEGIFDSDFVKCGEPNGN